MNTSLQAPGAEVAPRQIEYESTETLEANAPLPQEQSPPLKRVELRATDEFLAALDGLALKENLTRADIIRRGVGLYARMIVEKEKGQFFAVVAVENGGLAVKEVVQP